MNETSVVVYVDDGDRSSFHKSVNENSVVEYDDDSDAD